MTNPGNYDWIVVKWMLRYLKGSFGRGLKYGRENLGREMVPGYLDSDYARCVDTRKSQTHMIFMVFGTVGSWKASL